MAKLVKIFFVMMFVIVKIWADVDSVDVAVDSASSAPPPSAVALSDDSDSSVTPITPIPAEPVNYRPAAMSAVLAGTGQLYHERYVMGGIFLAGEVIAGGIAYDYWFNLYDKRRKESRVLRDSAVIMARLSADHPDDPSIQLNAGRYRILADQAALVSRENKYTAYNALAWTVGVHYYSLMDALELGGLGNRGEARDPKTAGLLAAVPFLGLGQIYNGRLGKSGMMAMTQASLAAAAVNHHRLMGMAETRYNEMRDSASATYEYRAEYLGYWKNKYDRNFSRRNTFLWLSLFTYIYSIMDAVVDAHLSDYHKRIEKGSDLSIGIINIRDGVGAVMAVEF